MRGRAVSGAAPHAFGWSVWLMIQFARGEGSGFAGIRGMFLREPPNDACFCHISVFGPDIPVRQIRRLSNKCIYINNY